MKIFKVYSSAQTRHWLKLCIASLLLFMGTMIFGQADIRKVDYQLPDSESPVRLTVEVKNGLVILEEDIILGTEEELFGIENRSAVILGDNRQWPGGIMPYEIEEGHPQEQTILEAIAHVNERTKLNLIKRNPDMDEDYIRFVLGNGCSSYVGRQGGGQIINIANGCGFGSTVHEICHAAGLFHEQARSNRDEWVTIHWDNIEEGKEHNFQTYVERGYNGADLGPYNYESIMHYGTNAFSSNGQATITVNSPPAAPGTTIGQRDALDVWDAATINALYPCTGYAPDVVACPYDSGNYDSEYYDQYIIRAENNIYTLYNDQCFFGGLIRPDHHYVWQAGESIHLGKGFTADSGTSFIAEIRGCITSSFDSSTSDDTGSETGEPEMEEEEGKSNLYLNIYPNPFKNSTIIAFEVSEATEVSLQVCDAYGKLLHQQMDRLPAGQQEFTFDGSKLPSGFYTVRLKVGDNIQTKRMVITK